MPSLLRPPPRNGSKSALDTLDQCNADLNSPLKLKDTRVFSKNGRNGFNLLSQTFPSSGVVALEGPNGSGKTTLFEHIERHPSLLSGGAAPVQVVHIPQNFDAVLFPYRSVWWNVGLPLVIAGWPPSRVRRNVVECMGTFGLQVDPNVFAGRLSGGERHFLVLLRMLLCPHRVILLDEPLTALDAEHSDSFWRALKVATTLNHKTMFISCHEVPRVLTQQSSTSFEGFEERPLTFHNCTLNI